MNPETLRVYTGREEIEAAEARGEKLIHLDPGIARALIPAEGIIKMSDEDVERINQHARTEAGFRNMRSQIPTLGYK